MNLPKQYYQRFDPQKHYEQLLFLPGRGLQSAELNDLQEQVAFQSRKISDTLLKDGDLVYGGELNIDQKTGQTKIPATAVYLQGLIRELPPEEIDIPLNTIFYIGIWLKDQLVTELEDPGLRDPATGTRNFNEGGAYRKQVQERWGTLLGNSEEEQQGTFYPVFRIDNGVHVLKQPPPQLDSVSVAIARYDRESKGGNYVVRGMEVIFREQTDSHQTFTITEGKVHIDGFTLFFTSSIRKEWPLDSDLEEITSEPHTFHPDETGKMRIELANTPLATIQDLSVVRQVIETVTRGSYEGTADELKNNSVVKILKVASLSQEFTAGIDFQRSGSRVDWSLTGQEPSTGETYQVIYQYRVSVAPDELDENGFSVTGAVSGTDINVDYTWKMPRIDLVTLDKEGFLQRLKGIPDPLRPYVPKTPSGQFPIAELHQRWWKGKGPEVINNSVRTITMGELNTMQNQINDLFDLVAIERLRTQVHLMDPAAKKGVFVDPFLDDNLRDEGVAQTAAIVDGELILPIRETILDLAGANQAETLDYELEPILNQPMFTGSMQVNPYQAFEPIPPKVTLFPQVDNWTTSREVWTGGTTRIFGQGTTSNRIIRTRRVAQQFLRTRVVRFMIDGFGPAEELSEILFDGKIIYPQQETT